MNARLCKGVCVRPRPNAPLQTFPAANLPLAGRPLCAALLWRNGVLSSTSTMVAAGSTSTVHVAQASSLDVLVLVGEVGMQAGLQSNGTLLLKNMWRAWSSELASLFYMWRTASSRSFSRCADRWCRLRAAGMSGAGRRAVLLLRCCWPSGARAAPASQLACT
eukprot:scaffold72168_cov55-Phaeocystis_antarctica.AAC.3